MTIEVSLERPGPELPAYLEVTVRADADLTVFAVWKHVLQASGADGMASAGDRAKPVDEAWEDALAYAEHHRVGLIFVDDPGGVFPAEDFGPNVAGR